MARLPTQGSDTDNWGTVLNDYLDVAHNADGTLKSAFNVRTYGAVGDGVTDDTVAVRAAATALANSARTDVSVTNDGRLLATGILYFPPGTYRITDHDALMVNATAPGRGYRLTGGGREATVILFAPTTAKYLVRNIGTGWMHIGFSDITFKMENANASFMTTDSTYAQRDFIFERINFVGSSASNTGFRNPAGVDNYDTFSFWHCGFYDTWGTFFWVESTDQAITHGFYECTWEVNSGNFIRLDKGGNVDVIGGSLLQIGAGTIFDLNGLDHNDGTCRFLVSGVRVELRAATAKLIDCEWNNGTIRFESVDNSAFASSATVNTQINASFGSTVASAAQMPIIEFDACSLQGRHEYRYNYTSYSLKQIVRYTGCEIRNYAAASDFIVATDMVGGAGTGGKAVAHFRDCRGSTANVFDTDVNWQTNSRGETSRKFVSVKRSDSNNPLNGGFEEVVLPKGAVVVAARMYAPGTGWTVVGGSTTAWTMKFQTTETTPTVLLNTAPGTLPSAGFNTSSATTLFHVCDTDVRRTIRLVADANIKDYTTAFIGIVEYIG